MDQQPLKIPEGYEVDHRLGAGQTSVVWLARSRRSQASVALKLPRREAQSDPVLRRMFENEVQITLKLNHPNVVRAFDGRPTGEGAFLALEYCPGGTLDQLLLEKGKLPLERALALVRDVAAGLEHTHEKRVLHRDVKPANVFLSEEGVAKLGDFGTGVFAAEALQERVGTAFYMAPELFSGGSSSIQSDVYSLGVLAYEVLAGARPFLGESYDALMVAHMTALPRDLRQHRPDLPSRVATVVMRAMSRDAVRRFQSAQDFSSSYTQAVVGAFPAMAARAAVGDAPSGRSGRGQARPSEGSSEESTTGRAGAGRKNGTEVGKGKLEHVKGQEEDAKDKDEGRGLFGSWWRRRRG